jgi:predicted MFS family arabinose efflux permease
LTGLFALDSLGGGFLAGSILSYWFIKRFGLTGEVIGPLFLVARGLNAGSYFVAEALARRLGLVRTMVFTHLPSSAFLLVLPWAPSALVAILLFLAREALVQMDVPARQAFVAQVTRPGERVYAFGVTGLARNVGWAAGPGLAGWSAQTFGLGVPLVIGAGLKMAYDLLLYHSFSRGVAL